MVAAWVLGPLGALLLALLLGWLPGAVAAVTRFRATCHHLHRFPRPPWRNWLLGHTGMVRGHGDGDGRRGCRDRAVAFGVGGEQEGGGGTGWGQQGQGGGTGQGQWGQGGGFWGGSGAGWWHLGWKQGWEGRRGCTWG